MGREGLWSGKGPPVARANGVGTLQTAAGARPISGGSRQEETLKDCVEARFQEGIS